MAAPARFVHNHSRHRAANESSDEQQDASSSSSSDDDGGNEEDEEMEVEGSEEEEEEAVADEPAARKSPAAAGRGGRKGPITISLKKVCKVVSGRPPPPGFPLFSRSILLPILPRAVHDFP